MRARNTELKKRGGPTSGSILIKLQSTRPTVHILGPETLPLAVTTRAFPEIEGEVQIRDEKYDQKDAPEAQDKNRFREHFRQSRLLGLQRSGNPDEKYKHGDATSPECPEFRSGSESIQVFPLGSVRTRRYSRGGNHEPRLANTPSPLLQSWPSYLKSKFALPSSPDKQ
jgi:hypothetical protein